MYIQHLLSFLNPCLIVKMEPTQVLFIGFTLVVVYIDWLNWFRFLIVVESPLVFSDRLHDFLVTIP